MSKSRLTSVDKAGLEERIKDSDSEQRPNVIHNGLRHSGITYRLRVLENAGAVAFWAGTSEKKVYNNYEGLVTDAEAEEYWAILPEAV